MLLGLICLVFKILFDWLESLDPNAFSLTIEASLKGSSWIEPWYPERVHSFFSYILFMSTDDIVSGKNELYTTLNYSCKT